MSRRSSAAAALNAFITETPDRALAMAKASDARRAKGEARLLDGIPLAIKDLFCTEGVLTTAGSHILDGFKPPYESTVTANLWRAGAVMLGKTNMDEFAMGSSNMTSYYGPVDNPWRRRGDNRPLVPGGSSGGSAAAVAARARASARDRHRHRRLDPPAGRLLRHRRHQADLRPLLALGHRRLRLVARPGRADDPHGRGRGAHAAASWPGTTRRIRPRSTAPVPDYRAGARPATSAACRIGIPKEYRIDGMPAEIEKLWQQGIAWLKAAGAETGRDLACRTPNTRCRPITSSPRPRPRRTSRAMTACASACGCRATASTSMYENTRAAGFGAEVRRRVLIGTYVLSAGYYDAYYLKAQKVRSLIAAISPTPSRRSMRS